MAGEQGRKRRLSHFLNPGTTVVAVFSHRCITYLLPALSTVGGARFDHENKNKDEVKIVVRLDVEMMLVPSAGGFAWSHVLKLKLEQGKEARQQEAPNDLSLTCKGNNGLNVSANLFCTFWEVPLVITRPLAPVGVVHRGKPRRKRPAGCNLNTRRRQLARGGEELDSCIRFLRRVLPGGMRWALPSCSLRWRAMSSASKCR